MIHRFDIAIIGGGPAGLATAIAAAERGCRSIAVVESKRRWGWPIQCAEMVPKMLGRIVPVPSEAIVQSVSRLQFYFDHRPIGHLDAPAHILDRACWETLLAERAAQLGATLLQPARALAMSGSGMLIARGKKRQELEARVIVGADGPNSLVRRLWIEAPMEFALAVQSVVPLAQSSGVADVFFSASYGSGYGWCFPRGNEANVGVALPFAQRAQLRGALKELIAHLAREGKVASSSPIRRTGGLAPAGGPVAQTVFPARDAGEASVVLVGDAAGQIHPLTGAGLLTACACGRMAGEAAARSLLEGNIERVAEYEEAWRDLYGDYFSRGLDSRRALARASPDTVASVLQNAWRFRSET